MQVIHQHKNIHVDTKGRDVIPYLRMFFLFLLSLLVFANFNGILGSLTGINNLGSPLMLICAVGLMLTTPLRRQDLGVVMGSFTLMIVLYWGIAWSSGLWYMEEGNFTLQDAKVGNRQLLTSLILVGTYYLIVIDALRSNKMDSLLYLFFIIFFVTLIAGISEDYLGLRKVLYQGYKNSRALGFFGNPNETGMQANLTFILACWLYMRGRMSNLFFVVVMGLSFYGAIVSFSRTAIILQVFVMMIFMGYLLISGINRRGIRLYRRHWALLISLVIGLYLSYFYFALPYYNSLDTGQRKRIDAIGKLVVKQQFDNKTTALRAGIFQDAIRLIRRRPLTGYGLHTFSKGGMFATSREHGVHNMYLKIIGEAGILPLLMYIMIVLLFLFGGGYIRGPEGIILTLFGVAIAINSFSSHGMYSQKFIISLWGVFLAVIHSRIQRTGMQYE